MYVLALSLRGVLAGKPVCERHLRSLTTSPPASGPDTRQPYGRDSLAAAREYG